MSHDDDPDGRRRFLLRATAGVGGSYMLAAAYPMLASLAPSERARAAGAPVEADIDGLAEGELRTVAWRGKPVWIMRRTPAELAALGGHDGLLADPDSKVPQQPPNCANPTRSIKPSIFVCVGLCTHLGCSPSLRVGETGAELGANWPGGFFCPCHGSKFDLAGRVFKGVPAPTNLEVPPYRYAHAGHIIVGDDKPAA
ncbi:MAG: ubiquinol-cytochrome c reductase iron-sulfur subunit [Sterolibacteriaceae bacterium]|nr:ubiquinol-cytochrome c reductase iron-sulfur subunit [Sterolibacteriaceae bacterium]MBK9087439.1 ubiquinol-cytochrome c reductase iron-sulfur subunit [Sterolibacteriaceae bacterium]